jgi:uncharacterized protein
MSADQGASASGAAPANICSNHDFEFFYAGLAAKMLLAQRCSGCRALRNPPGPSCPECHSFEWEAVKLSGEGVIYSFTIHHYPPLPNFSVPHPIVLAEMSEGIRLVGAMDGTDPANVAIGLPLQVEFLDRGGVPGFRFVPA